VKQVFAIEPNADMRQFAIQAFGASPACHILDGRAEATTLADHSVDLITVAQAIHWFEPQLTKTEFQRILKPGGWLAILRNDGTNNEIGEALGKVFPAETNTATLMIGKSVPIDFYYNGNDYRKQTFAHSRQATWEQFLGGLSSASYAPDEGSPLYANFERAARKVFDSFSTGGLVMSDLATELCLGQIKGL
jgi:ubiquinone/menaquinone biosynthesis C-methylase UbiE